MLAKLGYFIDIALLKTILSFPFVFEFVCKRMLSGLQKTNLENFIVYSIQKPRLRHDIYPARGRKLYADDSDSIENLTSPRYLPRKGTETRKLLQLQFSISASPRYLPRKGTETQKDICLTKSSVTFATIFTPQGDGNNDVFATKSWALINTSPRYLPRKGTETLSRL